MNHVFNILEFNVIKDKLENYAFTEVGKSKVRELVPYLSEVEVMANQRDTSEGRIILDHVGTPPMVSMKDVDTIIITALQGGLILPQQIEYFGTTLTAVRRLKDFLAKSKVLDLSIAYYDQELDPCNTLREEILRVIRNGQVDDYASNELKEIRREITFLEEKIKSKAEGMLKNNKEYFSDSFISNRNGHICLPVKKEYKFKINGSVIDKSSTGATLFIEPTAISSLVQELQLLRIDEENEVRKILYCLTAMIADVASIFEHNMKIITKLDFIFAKAKLSAEQNGIQPNINTGRYIRIVKGRHPLMNQETCVPLDFSIDGKTQGVIITGPNTGGKTVAIKTVGLFSIMTQCGLHVPCEEADICLNNQVLCDIGDGQNITENLSTFSSHITNVLDILKKANEESLVILDELGSGTDPTEGMGIAIAILEELKKSKCLFLATTHYPEVKAYAEKEQCILNARMAFDRETLKPLYKLELGKSGESCALYIAKRLGMPNHIVLRAYEEAYGIKSEKPAFLNEENKEVIGKAAAPKLQKRIIQKEVSKRADKFTVGDSVLVYPEKKIGIVCKKANDNGELVVQLKKEKIIVNHKRLQLYVKASELYPEDYDFSIIFDTVANRKARHKMTKKHQPGLVVEVSTNGDGSKM